MTNKKSVLRLTNQLNATISLKQINREIFFSDINQLREKKISN